MQSGTSKGDLILLPPSPAFSQPPNSIDCRLRGGSPLADMGTITASMNFLLRDSLYKEERPYLLIFQPPAGFPKQNIKLEKKTGLKIEDIRGREQQFSLEKNGFQITKIRSRMSPEDFDSEDLVKKVYLKEAADHVRELFGAQKVQIFEHLLRKRHEVFPISTGAPYKYNQPTSIAHVGECERTFRKTSLTIFWADTTHSWTEEMVRSLNPTDSDELMKGRVLSVK